MRIRRLFFDLSMVCDLTLLCEQQQEVKVSEKFNTLHFIQQQQVKVSQLLNTFHFIQQQKVRRYYINVLIIINMNKMLK